jgi:uncharacterized protein YecE (DUF72 family)
MNLYVGTSGYSYPEWKGKFYPKDLPTKQMLRSYGEHFRTVEINNTFYRLPTASVLQTWMSQVPADFKFALKAPQKITHIQRLKDAGDLVSSLFEVIGVLKTRLGPLLFQLPPNFKKDLPRLRQFLALLPPQHCAAFEFRHQSWFDDEVFGLLRGHGAALCIAEAEDDLKVPFVATADWGYVRLRLPDYSDVALKTWINRVREQKWRDAFVFFKHEDEGKGPQMAKRFLKLYSADNPRIPVEALTDLEYALHLQATGKRDPVFEKRIRAQSKKIQQEILAQHGVLNIAVDLIREGRDEE